MEGDGGGGIIGRSCHKYHFCCDKSFVATKMILVAATKVLLQQK